MQLPLNGAGTIYLQIAEMVENNILNDILLEEEQAPSTNEMARLYNINPATAAKGLNLLVDEGILYKKRGLGMFVATGAKQVVIEKHRTALYENFVKPLAVEMKNLTMSRQEILSMLERALQEEEQA